MGWPGRRASPRAQSQIQFPPATPQPRSPEHRGNRRLTDRLCYEFYSVNDEVSVSLAEGSGITESEEYSSV